MKQRVKAVHYADGTSGFYPQYRRWFRWRTYQLGIVFSGGVVKDATIDESHNSLEGCRRALRARLIRVVLHSAQCPRGPVKAGKAFVEVAAVDTTPMESP